jgi:hypothetical protein
MAVVIAQRSMDRLIFPWIQGSMRTVQAATMKQARIASTMSMSGNPFREDCPSAVRNSSPMALGNRPVQNREFVEHTQLWFVASQ